MESITRRTCPSSRLLVTDYICSQLITVVDGPRHYAQRTWVVTSASVTVVTCRPARVSCFLGEFP
jgi:hypothetical protein